LAEQTSRWMDPTLREYTVRIAIQRPESEGSPLRPSMRCEAEITLGRVADALTVPIQSVHSEGLLRYVHIPAPSGGYLRRPVLIGQRSDRFAEIKVGLQPGDRVLLRKPDPSELTGRVSGWNPEELAAVGLEVNANGDIVPTAAAMAARGGGGQPGRPGGRGLSGGGPGAGRQPRGASEGTEGSSGQDARPVTPAQAESSGGEVGKAAEPTSEAPAK
ncbi:MAG: hypothetical protein ACK4WH_15685, partial [Phycisphaerales bacterium]